ncbi:hypothetical protein AOQ84DRAFT_339534 [Glonium stellatum]|uniref:Uncharacterized protein n=1 Tax=Glonium stellatum TaxID=574774 RepID=A0A8E2F2L9_9PEZI|nr:hypothetical protein AOQ84DRAFT_339534 [Glonium stellatum]
MQKASCGHWMNEHSKETCNAPGCRVKWVICKNGSHHGVPGHYWVICRKCPTHKDTGNPVADSDAVDITGV